MNTQAGMIKRQIVFGQQSLRQGCTLEYVLQERREKTVLGSKPWQVVVKELTEYACTTPISLFTRGVL